MAVIDRSIPDPLDDPSLRAWGRERVVFVSSVIVGMEEERAAVEEAIQSVGARPVLFERLGGRDDDAESAYVDGVRSSDIYIGLLGPRYGRRQNTGYSATHEEFNEAKRVGLRISVWHTTGEMDGGQRDFLGDVQVFHTTGTFGDPAELQVKVERRLRELAAEGSSLWCKLGDAVFRAIEVLDRGANYEVSAVVRNAEVVHAIESLRPDEWNRSPVTQLTYGGTSAAVTVESVQIARTSGRRHEIDVVLRRADGSSREQRWDMSFNGKSPADLTELALRAALFGEDHQLGDMAFMASMDDPLEPLRSLQLSEEVASGVAEVLITESLVGSGRAERVRSASLGPLRSGLRRLRVEWLPRRQFSNETPTTRIVDGDVSA